MHGSLVTQLTGPSLGAASSSHTQINYTGTSIINESLPDMEQVLAFKALLLANKSKAMSP